jgi:excisionase family DNA binding protein
MMARPRKAADSPAHGEIMTLDHVAQYLDCDEGAVYRLIKRDKLPGFNLGSDWRFRRPDIDSWIAERQVRQGKERRER